MSLNSQVETFPFGAKTLQDMNRYLHMSNNVMRWNIQVKTSSRASTLWEALLPWAFLYAWKELCLFEDKVYGTLNEEAGIDRLVQIVSERGGDVVVRFMEAVKQCVEDSSLFDK
jgi:hypothetical protein